GFLVAPVPGFLVKRLGLPRREPFGRESRKRGRVARQATRLARRDARGLVLTVTVPRRAGEDADDDLRPEAPHPAQGVFEEGVSGRLAKRLFLRACETEVVGAGEVLSRTVETAGRGELLGPHEPEPDTEVRSDEILAPFAAGQREVRGLAAE